MEEEDIDEGVRRRLKDSSETPGALWHIYLNKDMDKMQEFLHKVNTTKMLLLFPASTSTIACTAYLFWEVFFLVVVYSCCDFMYCIFRTVIPMF